MNTIGERIRRIRQEAGLTQVNFAATLKVSPETVTLWETGRRSPSAVGLIALSREYAVDPDWLLTGEDGMHTHGDSGIDGSAKDRLAAEIIEAERRLGYEEAPERREQLVSLEPAALIQEAAYIRNALDIRRRRELAAIAQAEQDRRDAGQLIRGCG